MSDERPVGYLDQLFGLHGRTAVIIGGTGSLGSEICDALVQAGAYVYIVGNNEEGGQAISDRWPGHSEFYKADATQRDQLENLLQHLISTRRQCDILVNAAGINSSTPFLQITDAEWDLIMQVNLGTVRIASQIFGAHMIDSGIQGSIINIASMSALTPLSRVFSYSASKSAVLNLTQNLAREWAPHHIRVNAISPGFFPAEQNRKILTPDRVAAIMNHTPMQRFGLPQELAGAILLLASNHAGSFVTGSNVIVDGGFSCMTI